MAKKILRQKKDYIYTISLFFVLVFSFLFFQPKISSRINPFKRRALWRQFEKQITSGAPFNPRNFWIFREFYYPGYFTFERSGINRSNYRFLLNKAFFGTKQNSYFFPFLTYTSDKFIALEALVKTLKLSHLITHKLPKKAKILVQNEHALIYYANPKTVHVFFIEPYRTFIKTNGFLNYHTPDKNLARNKNWFVAAVIKLD